MVYTGFTFTILSRFNQAAMRAKLAFHIQILNLPVEQCIRHDIKLQRKSDESHLKQNGVPWVIMDRLTILDPWLKQVLLYWLGYYYL